MLHIIKSTNICIMGIPEREEGEKGTEKIFKEKWLKDSQIY